MYHEDTVVMIKTTKYTPGFLNEVNFVNNLKKRANQDYKELLKIRPETAGPLKKPLGQLKKKKVGKPQ